MTPHTSAYDDLADLGAPDQVQADCQAVDARLREAARRATGPVPSLHFDEQPREQRKRGVEVSEAAARLAAAIYG